MMLIVDGEVSLMEDEANQRRQDFFPEHWVSTDAPTEYRTRQTDGY